ncbi:MAG: FG-GAP repeat domain-containing protein, partial [Thermoanaerobaculia bacterium]
MTLGRVDRRRWASVLAFALLAAAVLGQAPPETSLARFADEQLAQLAEREKKAAPREVLLRNLARYFTRYTLPSQPEELGRLLGTLERMMDRAAIGLWEAAAAGAAAAGSATVGRAQLAAALERVLPATPNPWGEAVFFSRAPLAERIAVETIDLTAFRDTGIVWQRLSELAAAPAAAGAPPRLPLAPETFPLLADGVSAYGLLLLRLGGEAARAEYAAQVATHHLREAGEQLAQRAAAHATGAGAAETERLDAPPGSLFRDVTEESGIRFRHTTADWLSLFRRYGPVTPTFSGGGVTAGDADGDERDDLVFCGGRGCALFRNRGDGSFEDVTAAAGIGVPGEARMALLVDLDNDGRRDLFLTYSGEGNRLFKNLGGGSFADVTEASGLHRPGDMSGPAAAVDVDGDALLDLYVGNFGDFLHGENPWHPTDSHNAQPKRLYRNLGELRFEDTTERAGVGDTGWTQALSHVDYDADGDQDLLVANDFGRDALLENQGDGTFRSVGAETGTDDPFHGMNVAFADLNRDRLPDIFVTNIWFWNAVRDQVTETNSLFLSERRSDGRVAFSRSSDRALLGHDTGWAWGA